MKKSKAKVIGCLKVPTHDGFLEIEKYSDGDYLISTPTGRSFVICGDDALAMEAMFGLKNEDQQGVPDVLQQVIEIAVPVIEVVQTKKSKAKTIRTKKAIENIPPDGVKRRVVVSQSGGWLSEMNFGVSDKMIHVYEKRDQARNSSPSDKVGENGRIS